MNDLNNEIKQLEEKIAAGEQTNEGGNYCSCGYKLKPGAKFCPNCGESVQTDKMTCVCGAEVKRDSKFCQVCGRKIEDVIKISEIPSPPMKECICGAMVPADQFMCMECGRKLE